MQNRVVITMQLDDGTWLTTWFVSNSCFSLACRWVIRKINIGENSKRIRNSWTNDLGRRIKCKEILFLPICENQLSGWQVSVDHQFVFLVSHGFSSTVAVLYIVSNHLVSINFGWTFHYKSWHFVVRTGFLQESTIKTLALIVKR